MKYIALLRGINVGGKHSVSMSSLSTVFQNLGYSHVRTYINSGNVIFNSESENFSIIEPTLEKFYGFGIPVLTLSTKQLQNIYQAIQPDWHNNTEQKPMYCFYSLITTMNLHVITFLRDLELIQLPMFLEQ